MGPRKLKVDNMKLRADLAFVALDMETAIQGDDPHRFLLTWFRHYRIAAD